MLHAFKISLVWAAHPSLGVRTDARRLDIFNIQSEQHEQGDDDLRYPFMSAVRTNCELALEIFNIQSEQQHQRDDNLRLANLHSCPLSVRTALRTAANLLFVAYGTQDFQHSVRTASTKRRQLTTCQSSLVSAVRANCLRTANLVFVEVSHLGQNQMKLIY